MDAFDDNQGPESSSVRYQIESNQVNLSKMILLTSIIFCSLMLILVISHYFYAKRVLSRRATIHQLNLTVLNHHVESTCTGLDPALISSLPIFTIKPNVQEFNPTECVVCLIGLENEEKAKLLPNCNHFFHVGCIDTWLGLQSTCPLCRAGIQPGLELQLHEGPINGTRGDGDMSDGAGESLKVNGPSNSRFSSKGYSQ